MISRFVPTLFTSVGVFVGLLAIMGLIATPYADAEAKLITGGPFQHIAHMFSYAAQQVSPGGPQGIASYPWQWLLDLKPILYLRINPSLPGQEFHAIHPVTAFWGMPSPPIMALGMPALVFCLWRFLRRRRPGQSPEDQQVAMLAVSWFLGTWVPFAVLSLVDQRTSYIYYMVIVMPGIYVAATYAAALALADWAAGGCGGSSGCGRSACWWPWCSCTRSWRRSERGRGPDRRVAAGGPARQAAKISAATSSADRPVRSMTVTPASLRIQVSWRRA